MEIQRFIRIGPDCVLAIDAVVGIQLNQAESSCKVLLRDKITHLVFGLSPDDFRNIRAELVNLTTVAISIDSGLNSQSDLGLTSATSATSAVKGSS